jgi:hypothetical protein
MMTSTTDNAAGNRLPLFLPPPHRVEDVHGLLENWLDQTVTCRLIGAGGVKPLALGAHLRRSFLGALGRGASPQAVRDLPCPWMPPCALDIFCREQARDAHGNGLPKPYVIFASRAGDDLEVSLRVFGCANDWFMAGAEAFVAGMRDILPWQKVCARPMPLLGSRLLERRHGLRLPVVQNEITLQFLTPVDAGKPKGDSTARPDALERSLLSRLLRRVDALSPWQGTVLNDAAWRSLHGAIEELDFSASQLVAGRHESANRTRQRRHHRTVTGQITLRGEGVAALLPVLVMAERCHAGRAAREGLGRFRLIVAY